MGFSFEFDQDTLSFGTVMVRAKILWSEDSVKLKPTIQIDVVKGSGYEGKVQVRNAELIEYQKAYRFFVDIKEGAFSIPEYKDLILGKKPLPLLVTLYPDIAAPIPTAGVPIPSVSPAIADDVLIEMPKTVIGLVDAEQDMELPPGGDMFRLKARVLLPRILKDRSRLEKKYSKSLEFTPGSENVRVTGISLFDDVKRADIIPAKRSLSQKEPLEVKVTISVDIEGIPLKREIVAGINPVRRLELHLNRGFLQASMNKPESLLIKAMEVLDTGERIPARDAWIEIHMPDEISGFAGVQPSSGPEEVTIQVSQTGVPKVKESYLSVVAMVPEGSVEKKVPLLFDLGNYSLRIEPKSRTPPYLIRWEKVQWVCDPVTVTVLVDGEIRKDIELGEVSVKDERGWLELEAIQKTPGAAQFTAQLRPRSSPADPIAPPAGDELEFRDFSAREEADLAPHKPGTDLFSTVTFTVGISSRLPLKPGSDAARAAITAGTMVPIPDTLIPSPGLEFTGVSDEIRYIVEPPQFAWKLGQEEPIRMSGDRIRWNPVIVRAENIPRGWDSGTTVGFCFGEPGFRKWSGLKLRPKKELRPPSADLSDPNFQIVGVMDVLSTILGLKEEEKETEPVPESVPLKIITEGEMLGRVVQTLSLDVLPLPVALYLEKFPYSGYPWENEAYRIQARKSADVSPTDWSKLGVSLRYPVGWAEPPVEWVLKGEGLEEYEGYDDYFTSYYGTRSTYIAPTRASWAGDDEAGLGAQARLARCVVGKPAEKGVRSVIIDETRGICSSIVINTELSIRKPLGNAVVRITVKPAGFPLSPEAMDLSDKRVYDSVVRTFSLEIDLQKLPVCGREEK